MFQGNAMHKVLEFQLGGPVGPLPDRVVSITPQTIKLRNEGDLFPGETVEVRLNLGSRTLFSIFGKVADAGEDATILVMASTPGLLPWLKRVAKMGYITLEEPVASVGSMPLGLGWVRPSEPGVKN